MPSKLQLTEGLVELITLAKEGLTAVERSNAFDEWVDQLTEVSEGVISTQERRIITWLLEIVRKLDVSDFFDFDLQVFSRNCCVLSRFQMTLLKPCLGCIATGKRSKTV